MKSKISFFDFFWNPIIGCREKCPYCIGKKYITESINIFDKKFNWCDFIKNKKIFVNPYSEPFYWEEDILNKVLSKIEENNTNQYWIFTKHPEIFHNTSIPNNLNLTFSVTSNKDISKTEGMISNKIWISFAPLLENINFDYFLLKGIKNIFLCKKNENMFNYYLLKNKFVNVIEV